jgi:hypothetical protein
MWLFCVKRPCSGPKLRKVSYAEVFLPAGWACPELFVELSVFFIALTPGQKRNLPVSSVALWSSIQVKFQVACNRLPGLCTNQGESWWHSQRLCCWGWLLGKNMPTWAAGRTMGSLFPRCLFLVVLDLKERNASWHDPAERVHGCLALPILQPVAVRQPLLTSMILLR